MHSCPFGETLECTWHLTETPAGQELYLAIFPDSLTSLSLLLGTLPYCCSEPGETKFWLLRPVPDTPGKLKHWLPCFPGIARSQWCTGLFLTLFWKEASHAMPVQSTIDRGVLIMGWHPQKQWLPRESLQFWETWGYWRCRGGQEAPFQCHRL